MSSKRSVPVPYTYPQFYSFPPFFTLQPNAATRATQLEIWTSFVSQWCDAHNTKEILVASAKELPVFSNKAIERSLSESDIVQVLDALATAGYGMWVHSDKTLFAVSTIKIPELAHTIYKWAKDYGYIDNMATLEELCKGTHSQGEKFHGLPYVLLHTALLELEKNDLCVLVEGDSLAEIGIKFLAQ